MNKFLVHAVAAAVSFGFSAGAMAQSMSKADYKAGRDRIAAEFKSAQTACVPMTGNAKDICKAQATGRQSVARAELEERFAPSGKNRHAVRIAKADVDFLIAKEKCDDRNGNEKRTCMEQAKAAEIRAKADADAQFQTADAGRPVKKVAAAPAPKKEAPKEYVEDSVITAKVKTAVFEEHSLKSAEINVETYKGIVQLSGFVRSRDDIKKAVEVARGVKGVTSVKNVMIVKGQQ